MTSCSRLSSGLSIHHGLFGLMVREANSGLHLWFSSTMHSFYRTSARTEATVPRRGGCASDCGHEGFFPVVSGRVKDEWRVGERMNEEEERYIVNSLLESLIKARNVFSWCQERSGSASLSSTINFRIYFFYLSLIQYLCLKNRNWMQWWTPHRHEKKKM